MNSEYKISCIKSPYSKALLCQTHYHQLTIAKPTTPAKNLGSSANKSYLA